MYRIMPYYSEEPADAAAAECEEHDLSCAAVQSATCFRSRLASVDHVWFGMV